MKAASQSHSKPAFSIRRARRSRAAQVAGVAGVAACARARFSTSRSPTAIAPVRDAAQGRRGEAVGEHGDRELPDRDQRVAAMNAAVIVFPGINRERDMARTLELVSGREPAMVWHARRAAAGPISSSCRRFSYGDYLRCGPLRRAPVMDAVRALPATAASCSASATASRSCASGPAAGRADRNAQLKFICKDVYLKVERSGTAFTRATMPVR